MTKMGNPQRNLSRIEQPAAEPLPSPAEQRAERLASGRVVIACGGRNYADPERVFAALDLAHGRQPITVLVHGACMDSRGELLGADRWCDQWARERGVELELHPANWALWGRAAGPMRNKQMAEAGAHGCIAFPGGSGTSNMTRLAERFGIAVWRPFG